MKSVIVRYKVQSSYAETNAANIQRVMNDLREQGSEGIHYQAFRQQDGVSFVHFGMYRDEESLERMTALESFKRFQQELRASGPVEPPRPEWLDIIGSSQKIF